MELYRVKGDAKPKDTTPTRVLIIEHFYADFRLADQFDGTFKLILHIPHHGVVILPRGGKKTFKLDPDQIKCGERSLWVQALQTALLCDNALERYGEDITKQLMTYASKQVSEFGSLRLDDSMWKTLRKRSIHGDLWSRFQELVTKGIELTEVVPPPAVGLRYLFCMDMGSSAAAPRQIRLVPMVPINNEGTDNSKNELENGVVDPVVRHIDLQHIVSVTDCSGGSGNISSIRKVMMILRSVATDAAVRLRQFTLTHVVENEPVVEVFETASTDLRSRLVFGLAYILKNYNAAKQQHSPRQLRLRRLSPPTTSSSPGLPTMTTREERASASQVSTTSSLDVLGGVSNQHVDAAIRSFNVRPKNGIAMAVDLGVIDNENPTATAEFLRHTKGLDKDKVGEYLGGDDVFSVHVLLAYAMCKPFEVCLRDFLSKFRLPGESQKIDRMMEAFAKAFHTKNPHVFQHHDAAHILVLRAMIGPKAFSTIMLNTDLHNKCMTNRNRMTKSQFVRNNRGIDKDKSDIPHAILEGIFDSIKVSTVVTIMELSSLSCRSKRW
ncbi:hypothetical protein B5M09_007177 [Aphanomyces astaci]|uniref:SEC7 domain-containing protein n=1 Tax=Aphanomyces astaci TaxID=112090 RepID=A0A425DFP7_APHAT|nr:hypothetical protein B5M09_007177 [Aphanomyces astaci]